jgi:hypothetical protein
MKLEHSGRFNTVFTISETGHRVPYSWDSETVPAEVQEYVDKNDLWSDEILQKYLNDYPKLSQSEEELKKQERINNESRDYLASTDWYIVRQQETGAAVPQEILDARQAAREAVV